MPTNSTFSPEPSFARDLTPGELRMASHPSRTTQGRVVISSASASFDEPSKTHAPDEARINGLWPRVDMTTDEQDRILERLHHVRWLRCLAVERKSVRLAGK
jgi:hypothetical protein